MVPPSLLISLRLIILAWLPTLTQQSFGVGPLAGVLGTILRLTPMLRVPTAVPPTVPEEQAVLEMALRLPSPRVLPTQRLASPLPTFPASLRLPTVPPRHTRPLLVRAFPKLPFVRVILATWLLPIAIREAIPQPLNRLILVASTLAAKPRDGLLDLPVFVQLTRRQVLGVQFTVLIHTSKHMFAAPHVLPGTVKETALGILRPLPLLVPFIARVVMTLVVIALLDGPAFRQTPKLQVQLASAFMAMS